MGIERDVIKEKSKRFREGNKESLVEAY